MTQGQLRSNNSMRTSYFPQDAQPKEDDDCQSTSERVDTCPSFSPPCFTLDFFPSNAFMASARSFNTFNCMFQIGLQELIRIHMAVR